MPDHPTRSAAPGDTRSVVDADATSAPSESSDPSHASPAVFRYEFGDEIARGGMGVIHRATDTVLGREVAVKVLSERFGPGSGAARRFADEARITAQLQHPAIPPIHDLGTLPDGRPFLAMKLIKGDTLDELLKESTDRGRFVAAFEAVCQAVAFAHSKDVVHRDLKPANVMVGNFGEVQVMDWGLAKQLRNAERGTRNQDQDPDATADVSPNPHSAIRIPNSDLTQAGSVLGTPAFMPPEQAIGAIDQIDARSDVFGLGGILCAILTGRPPFQGETAESTRQLAAKGKVQDCFARLDASGADPEMVALCKRCLAPEKDDRPANAGAVAKTVAELRAAADERARQAELNRAKAEGEKTAAEVRATELRRRRKLTVTAGAVVGITLAVATAVSTWQARLARAAETSAREAETTARSEEAAARKAQADAVAARDAETRERESTDEVVAFVSSVFSFASSGGQGKQPVRDPTVRQALDNAEVKIRDRFSARPLVEAKVRKAIGEAFHGLRDFVGALPHFRRRLDIHRAALGDDHETTWVDMNNVGQILANLGGKHYAEAELLLGTVLAKKRTRLGDENLSTLKGINNLAGLYRRQARAEAQLITAVPYPLNLPHLIRRGERLALSETLQEENYRVCVRTLPADHEHRLNGANNMGALRIDQGRPGEAVPYFREAAEGYQKSVGDRFPTAQCWSNVGDAFWVQEKLAAAAAEYRKALTILDRIPAQEGAALRKQIDGRLAQIQAIGDIPSPRVVNRP